MVELLLRQRLPEVRRHEPFRVAGLDVLASGSTIDWWTNDSSGCFAVFAYETRLSRSGPTFPVAFAALSVWHAEQPFELKTVRPACAGEMGVVLEVVDVEVVGRGRGSGRWRPAFFSCFLSQVLNAAGYTTTAWLRMSEWPSPHSSVHSSGNVPRRVGVTCSCVTSPGTMSSLTENSGTKTEWMTSSERM